MKKILSLVMVVAMLVAVLALVGCNDTNKPADTTAGSTTAGSTTAGSTTAGSTTAGTTTAGTTTAGTTTAGTTAADDTTAATTTLPPVFARFDFGTASKAEDLGMTSHEYLVEALAFDANFLKVEYTEDTMIVSAVQSHPEMILGEDGKEAPGGRYEITSYALCYEDLVTYDFDDELKKENNFMRFRIKNNTTNNIMSFRWHKAGQAYATTLLATCMYLQGGAPTVDDYVNGNHKLVADAADTEFKTYTYDINFLATMGRNNTTGDVSGKSYVHMAYYVGLGGGIGSNNWAWAGTQEIVALRFYVLGAYGGPAYCPAFDYGDSRAFIEEGDSIEIDYIIFGAKDNLKTFTSYAEDAYNESVSISKSISVAESEAAATATTAAAWFSRLS